MSATQADVEMDAKYPEHKKMKDVMTKSEVIGDFLDWLLHQKKVKSGRFERFEDDAIGIESNIELAIWRPSLSGDSQLVEYQYRGIENLLADYFGIDLKKVEQEKRQMLDSFSKKAESFKEKPTGDESVEGKKP